MTFGQQLQNLLSEYQTEIGRKSIPLISLLVPRHKGSIYIMDTAKRTLDHKVDMTFTMVLSINPGSRYGASLKKRIDELDELAGFDSAKSGRNITCSKNLGNNPEEAITLIEKILRSLFPATNTELIEIDVKRISEWHTLK